MQTGSTVLCIDGYFAPYLNEFYVSFPKQDQIYKIRQMTLGISPEGKEGEVSVCLVGLYNPKSNKPPFNERGFNIERFREIEPPPPKEKKEDIENEEVKEKELVEI